MTKRVDPKKYEGVEPLATGYKILNNDWSASYGDYNYADENGNVEGTVHTMDGDLKHCENGLHFCKNPINCMSYYPMVQWNKFAKISAFDEVKDHSDCKSECRTMRIDKVLSWDKFLEEMKSVQQKELQDQNGIRYGSGISYGSGIRNGYGINYGYGISGGYGIYRSKYCKECEGISNCIFTYKKSGKLYLFNKKVTQEYFDQIWHEMERLADGWYPNFTNAEELMAANGGEWKATPAPMITGREDTEAYADMPQKLIDYIKALPEYNAKIFKAITGRE